MKQDFSDNIIRQEKSIKDALEVLETMHSKGKLTMFVVDNEGRLVGTLTDGDVRRGLIEGKKITENVGGFMHRDFRSIVLNKYTLQDIQKFKAQEINLIPLLSEEGKILQVIDISDKKTILPLDIVIMAGGEGKRLRPLTEKIPKPLLPVGAKPILEHSIDRLYSYGVSNIYISINYLGEQIVGHFGNGHSKEMNIRYIKEEEPLGTIGSVSLVDDFVHDHVLVMNSDLLTNIDFEDLFKTFIAKNADMMVATTPYRVNIPYAVLETEKGFVTAFKEKPTYTYYSNAGIYMFKKSVLRSIPYKKFYNATDLMERLIAENARVAYYPILGYWLDIGHIDEYNKAKQDFEHINF
jgi:dTDP-glucose pyrophosphorylase